MSDDDRTSLTGTPIPDVTLHTLENGKPQALSARDLFKYKTVVLFALPGAFTPTCSTNHLPRYEELSPALRRFGADEVVCLSVNDPFVMDEWARAQGIREVRMVADGNGDFTEALGMMLDKRALGLGRRSRRYALLVKNGRIDAVFAEPLEDGDPYGVSDADTMLHHLAGEGAEMPHEVAILTRRGCSFCARARERLQEAGLDYSELELPAIGRGRALRAIGSSGTTPQIFIDGELIGGLDELEKYLERTAA